jgi:hypothetical protein
MLQTDHLVASGWPTSPAAVRTVEPTASRPTALRKGAAEWFARRHSLGVEAVIVVALYIIYDSSRGLVGGGRGAAFSHARSVMSWERAASLNIEHGVQTLAGAVPGLMRLFRWGYMALHLGATVAALVWLHRRRSPEAYTKLRTALMVASLVGLVGFVLFPTAPPRLAVAGIADSVSHGAVNLNGSTLRWLYNPYAAMPSMHLAYATLVGYSLVRWGRRSWVRWLGGLYPMWVTVEVIATGNHFLLDIAAGVLVAAVALIATSNFVNRRDPVVT